MGAERREFVQVSESGVNGSSKLGEKKVSIPKGKNNANSEKTKSVSLENKGSTSTKKPNVEKKPKI